MEKTNSESKSEDKSNEEEKVDDLLNTFNKQLKIEQKSADQKVNNRFKPYESKNKKRKRKSLSQKVQAKYMLFIFTQTIIKKSKNSSMISISGRPCRRRKTSVANFQKLLGGIALDRVFNRRPSSCVRGRSKRK